MNKRQRKKFLSKWPILIKKSCNRKGLLKDITSNQLLELAVKIRVDALGRNITTLKPFRVPMQIRPGYRGDL